MFKTTEGRNSVNNIRLKYDFRKVYTIDYDTNGGKKHSITNKI